LPRWVYEKVGGFDEDFEGGYWEDDDFINRLNENRIPISLNHRIEVEHLNGGGLTMKKIGEQEHFDKNKEI